MLLKGLRGLQMRCPTYHTWSLPEQYRQQRPYGLFVAGLGILHTFGVQVVPWILDGPHDDILRLTGHRGSPTCFWDRGFRL